MKSDWEREQEEREWQEGKVVLPAYPKPENLIEFVVSAASRFRFFVDQASLSVGKEDGVVRYTLVARSAAGVENVSYEGIRCKSGTYKVYAVGRESGKWTEHAGDWRRIEPKGAHGWHYVLRREYFCPQHVSIFDAAEGLDALRRGGHPNAGQ